MSEHHGAVGPHTAEPEKSVLSKAVVNEAIRKLNPFDSLIAELRVAYARKRGCSPRKMMLIFEAPKRGAILAKADRALETGRPTKAAKASRQPVLRYDPNAPVDAAVLRRVIAVAKRGVLTATDLQSVKDAYRAGLALPGFVLRKLAEVRS
ncbi:MAG: hypothetical protein EPN31_14430 [Castellaniella sp.]|uniref:hypothetical protein n=1 Tax=Castellaniella sp. TaxID=1955812 RepID=UPI00120AB0B2|nr:hypothetical protein [Castellaniella sp.]TAN25868.1 MAG: hypothetical protein EPN31_14430 [Castellaniella sp.]